MGKENLYAVSRSCGRHLRAQGLCSGWRALRHPRKPCSYVVNLAAARLLTAGELQMSSGARIPIPRGREGMVREAVRSWTDR